MARNDDREHFENYRDQTKVKHEILEAYLAPYFRIDGTATKNLLYIDGSAGPGTYTKADSAETFDGSPLRALKLIAEDEAFSKKVTAYFIESDKVLFQSLEKVVTDFWKANSQIRKPVVECCAFT